MTDEDDTPPRPGRRLPTAPGRGGRTTPTGIPATDHDARYQRHSDTAGALVSQRAVPTPVAHEETTGVHARVKALTESQLKLEQKVDNVDNKVVGIIVGMSAQNAVLEGQSRMLEQIAGAAFQVRSAEMTADIHLSTTRAKTEMEEKAGKKELWRKVFGAIASVIGGGGIVELLHQIKGC